MASFAYFSESDCVLFPHDKANLIDKFRVEDWLQEGGVRLFRNEKFGAVIIQKIEWEDKTFYSDLRKGRQPFGLQMSNVDAFQIFTMKICFLF